MAISTTYLLCFILYFTLFSVSTSKPLFFPLTHTLSTTQFTSTHHLLKSISTRSTTRFQHHHHHNRHHEQVSLPLYPGSDYTLSFTLNTNPPQPVSLYLDTGSDLVWFPCHPFECILCENKADNVTTPPKLPSATKLHCSSAACSAAHGNVQTSDLCVIAKCPLESLETSDCDRSFTCPPFYYAYGDGSLIARLYSDSVTLPLSASLLVLRNFTFGCAHTALAEPVGVAGFGRGVLSLPAQLASFAPQLGNQFSYCLVSHSFNSDRVQRPSPLILGSHDDQQEKRVSVNVSVDSKEPSFIFTSMLENAKHPYFYCVGLNGISIGNKYIPAPDNLRGVGNEGSGGMVVDSGTTFTMLPASLYNSMVSEFKSRVGRVYKRAKAIEDNTGLSPCYHFDNNVVDIVPRMVLHFVGNGSSVALPRKNYFYEFLDGGYGVRKRKKVGCLMLMNAGDETELRGGPGGVLGNYQQQGFEVVYDLEKRRVGFARRRCASLWESLN